MSRTVHMHIGLAKSGTTYVQHILHVNRTLLGENGVLFPGPKASAHFMAALDLSDASFHGHAYPEAVGAWARMVAEANGFSGSTLISHEMFAPVSAEAIDRALTSLDTDDRRVVITARDLARQVPAVWQERVKNGSEVRYFDYLDSVFRSERGQAYGGAFWRQQHLIGVSRKWAKLVGVDRLTIVTVPAAGADPRELWHRFAAAVELPDLAYSLDAGARNRSLGVVESELLRRLNGRLPELPWPQYARRVKHRYAEGTLAAASDGDRLVVPADYREDVARVADLTIDRLQALGCRVIGDLEDLRPSFPASDPPTPDGVADSVVLDLALTQLGKYVSRPPAPPKPPADPVAPRRTLADVLKARLRRD